MREPHESLVERKIREAQEQGAFDDLPGKGRPLRGLHAVDDENWWIRGFVERHGLSNEALLPTPLRLRKELERLPETVRELPTEDAVRAVVRELNARVAAFNRVPTGPRVSVHAASVEDVVTWWRAEREARSSDDRASARPARPARPSGEPDGRTAGTDDSRGRRFRRLWFVRRR